MKARQNLAKRIRQEKDPQKKARLEERRKKKAIHGS